MKTAVFTIASRNYFAFVKTLMASLKESNPDYERYVGVCDKITADFQVDAEDTGFIPIEDLNLPEAKKMIFRYNVLELNTAIKPFVFKKLFNDYGFDRVIYFDPDIYVYERLTVLEELFEKKYEIIMTPHLTGRYDDSTGTPNDLDIMKSGVYNLGFLALSKSDNVMQMLDWWGKKLETQCIASFKDGLFVDQKWMDLVPGMFDRVYILKHPGYNTAYWNLSHRKWTMNDDKKWFFNDKPLVFFHFSGLNPENITQISKYQDRFNTENIGELKILFAEYAAAVLKNGYGKFRKIKYAYNYFDDGTFISDVLRKLYREDERLQKECGSDPFSGKVGFYKEKVRILASLMELIWKDREDIRKIYPSYASKGYVKWFLKKAQDEYKIFPEIFESVNEETIFAAIRWKQCKDGGKYRARRMVKDHVSEKTWRNCKKVLKRFWDK